MCSISKNNSGIPLSSYGCLLFLRAYLKLRATYPNSSKHLKTFFSPHFTHAKAFYIRIALVLKILNQVTLTFIYLLTLSLYFFLQKVLMFLPPYAATLHPANPIINFSICTKHKSDKNPFRIDCGDKE